nr:pentatricopeptide repeat protein AaPPR1355 [Agave angustifolia]
MPSSLFSSLLDSSTRSSHLFQIHALILTSGLLNSPPLTSKLLRLSSDFNQIHYARQLFDQIPLPNLFLYNNIIKLHSNQNLFTQILQFYSQMIRSKVGFDGFTLPPVLKACAGLSNLNFGCSVHAQIVHFGFESDTFVKNGLISMYAKCGEIGLASNVFNSLENGNVISWTSILSGFSQNGHPLEALRIFRTMRVSSDVRPDFIVLVSVLKAYTDVEDLEHGRSIHGLVFKLGLDHEVDLVITLCAMYAKCGQVLIARQLFDRMQNPDVILWNAMISGYAKNGFATEAVELFKEMAARNIRPDSITIRSAIMACAQLGSLELGKWMEDYTQKSEYKDNIFVKTTIIDMYAKCGSIINAHRVFDAIRDKDVVGVL